MELKERTNIGVLVLPESKLHRFLKTEILPCNEKTKDSFLYRNLGVWFSPKIDKKLGHTMHRPDGAGRKFI